MRKHRADLIIPLLTFILMAVGLVVIYTIGPVRAKFLQVAYGGEFDSNYFIVRQLISVALATAVFIICYKLNYRVMRKFTTIFMGLALLACVVLALSQWLNLPIAKCELGACRWFNIAGISIQPAELLKFGLAIYLARITAEYKRAGGLSKKRINWAMFKEGIKTDSRVRFVFEFIKRFLKSPIGKFWAQYALAAGLSLFFVVVIQKDLGSGIPILVEALAILFVAGVSKKVFAVILTLVFIAGVGVVITSPHRVQRVMTFLGMSSSSSEVSDESEADDEESGDAYHIENALIAIGSGGLTGVGVGNSVQATGYLPESINDSVFAIMGETFGFVGLIIVLALFAALLLRLLRVADYSENQEMSLIAVAAFAWLATHVVVNIMAMTGLAPLTGITLPLLSYGGTSMMCVAAILGLTMQVSQYTGQFPVSDKDRVASMKDGGVRTASASRARYVPGGQFSRISSRRNE